MPTLKSLSPNEIESYQKKGFTKVGHTIFSDHDYQNLKLTINSILKNNGNKEATTAVPYVHLVNPEILFWLLADNVLDICEDILGPNVGLLSSTLFYKKAQTTEKAYWHTDTSGLAKFNLFEDKNLLNFTISFTTTDASNGCLRYLPGTQLSEFKHDWEAPQNGLITYSASIRDEMLDLNSIEHMELGQNEASLHNVNVVHGSEPNFSERDRITLSCRFFSASTRRNIENFKKNNVFPRPFLVRGQDLASSQLKVLTLK